MTPEEFRSLLDTYGADLTRWPHAKRQDVHRYLQESEDARDAFVEAQEFDALLSAHEPVLADSKRANLLDSIMDDLPDRPNVMHVPRARQKNPDLFVKLSQVNRPTTVFGGVIARPLTPLLAVCLAMGIGLGAMVSISHQSALSLYSQEYRETMTIYGLR